MKIKNSKLKINRGVTLIELIISVAVISIAILSIYVSLIYAIRINHQAKDISLAYSIANKEMETIRNTTFTNLINQTNGNLLSDSTVDLEKLTNGQGQLTIADYNSDVNIKEITVVISWTENGISKNVTLTTLVSSGGINP